MHTSAHKCTQVHTSAHECTQVHTSAHECTRVHTNAHQCTRMHTNAHKCTRMHASAHGCTRLHVSACECHIRILTCTHDLEARMNARECTHECLRVHHRIHRALRRITDEFGRIHVHSKASECIRVLASLHAEVSQERRCAQMRRSAWKCTGVHEECMGIMHENANECTR